MPSMVQVSSIRAKFSRRSPDGASDDYLVDSDRNVWPWNVINLSDLGTCSTHWRLNYPDLGTYCTRLNLSDDVMKTHFQNSNCSSPTMPVAPASAVTFITNWLLSLLLTWLMLSFLMKLFSKQWPTNHTQKSMLTRISTSSSQKGNLWIPRFRNVVCLL